MFEVSKPAFYAAAIAAALALPAHAADLYEPAVVEAPPPVEYVEPAPAFGGWYIRGDVDYSWGKFRGAEYSVVQILRDCCGNITGANIVGGNALTGDLRSSFSVGGGVGYQISRYLRTDLTLDYQSKMDFRGTSCQTAGCAGDDITSMTALSLMANAYADLGTYWRVTPYVGAGIGGSHVKWDTLVNSACNPGPCATPINHPGYKDWRFSWALMAGASVKVTHNVALDLGYKYQRISGGRMFGFGDDVGGPFTGHGHDKGIDLHSVRAGLRYSFGAPAVHASYEPEPIAPVYK